MSGKITFVGAGPGAVDLITLRGAAALDEAELVIYAGSLVNEKLLERPAGAELVNSAKLSLDEVLAHMVRGYRAGKRVVRLHTGDPAIYGAVSEQYRELDRLGIPYDVVPGVSSVFAAAAELKVELTMPELSQSVILTRAEGRTPVPEKEALELLAAHGATLCIYLSVSDMNCLVERLYAAGLPPETPAAVVYRASWPNGKIVRGTLADIARKVEEAGIKRQSMIIVGRVLGRDGALSKLYDDSFATGYRNAGGEAAFAGKAALFAMSAAGAHKAAEIAAGLEDAVIFLPEKYAEIAPAARLVRYPDGGFAGALEACWDKYDGLVMVMAAGIVVRHIAPLCRHKSSDPAVVVCDAVGDYAVSLLSGHLGGANRLAAAVARITGGRPVVTTATDAQNLMAFDELASRHGYRIDTPQALKGIAVAMLDGETLELSMPQELYNRYYAGSPQFRLAADMPEITVRAACSGLLLRMSPSRYALGIGCRRGVSAETIGALVDKVLKRKNIAWESVVAAGTAELKRDEAGLLAFAETRGVPLRFFGAEELNAVDVPNPSAAAASHVGIRSVSEAAALLAAGPGAELVVEKTAAESVTVAVAEVVNG
ncbi:MAG: precorrin-4 C(11)-methyltransferase [Lentisphaeria bacterium]|nr:precorrin-4 C(11)-methyltransferase [Lentisphaeria bacterium]